MIRNGIWILLVWGLVVAAACSQMRKPEARNQTRRRQMLAYPGPSRLPSDYLDKLRRSGSDKYTAKPARKSGKAVAKVQKKHTKKYVSKSPAKKSKKVAKRSAPRRRTAALKHRPHTVGAPSGLVRE